MKRSEHRTIFGGAIVGGTAEAGVNHSKEIGEGIARAVKPARVGQLLAGALLVLAGAGVQAGSITFSSPGSHTWTPPAGLGSVNLTVIGGGGGGSKAIGGSGAKVHGSSVVASTSLYLYVGGGGGAGTQSGVTHSGAGGGGASIAAWGDSPFFIAGGGGGGGGDTTTLGSPSAGGSSCGANSGNASDAGGAAGGKGGANGTGGAAATGTTGSSPKGGDGAGGAGGNGGKYFNTSGGTGGAGLSNGGTGSSAGGGPAGRSTAGGGGGGWGGGSAGGYTTAGPGGGAGGSKFSGGSCEPAGNGGAVRANGANGSIEITWSDTLQATVTGLSSGESLVLQPTVNGVTQLNQTLTSVNDATTPLTLGSTTENNANYGVTTVSQPNGKSCAASNTTGALNGVVTVAFTCTANTYSLKASATGLAVGDNLVLSSGVTGMTNQTVSTDNNPATLGIAAHDTAYNVAVVTQPTGKTCTALDSASGNLIADTTVIYACATSQYAINVQVSGLTGNEQLIMTQGADTLTATATAPQQSFDTLILHDGSYAVIFGANPLNKLCSVSSGQLQGSNITAPLNIVIECVEPYVIGGQLSDLPPGYMLVLQNNGGDDLTVLEDGSFAFLQRVADGQPYDVRIKTIAIKAQKQGQAKDAVEFQSQIKAVPTCNVINGSGTVSGGPPSNIGVVCKTFAGSVTPVPTLNGWAILMLTAIAAALGWRGLQRRVA